MDQTVQWEVWWVKRGDPQLGTCERPIRFELVASFSERSAAQTYGEGLRMGRGGLVLVAKEGSTIP